MKRLLYIATFALSLAAAAQRPTQPDRVFLMVGDSAYAIPKETTQTEVKPGWKIVDVQTKSRSTRYLWGGKAKQMTDSRRPTFVIDIDTCQLTDYVVIRLKAKKSYRKFPKVELMQCEPHRIGLDWAHIQLLPDERYSVMPISAMEPGEYVLVCLKTPPVNDMGDVEVYPFTVPKN